MEIVENDYNLLEDQLIFQLNGAPPHYGVQFREFLNERFSPHDELVGEVQ